MANERTYVQKVKWMSEIEIAEDRNAYRRRTKSNLIEIIVPVENTYLTFIFPRRISSDTVTYQNKEPTS